MLPIPVYILISIFLLGFIYWGYYIYKWCKENQNENRDEELESVIEGVYANDPNNTIDMSVVEAAPVEIVTVNSVIPSTKEK